MRTTTRLVLVALVSVLALRRGARLDRLGGAGQDLRHRLLPLTAPDLSGRAAGA